MVDTVQDLTTEMLRRMHSKLDEIQSEMRLRFTGVETGLAAIDHHLAAFHAVDAARADEIAISVQCRGQTTFNCSRTCWG